MSRAAGVFRREVRQPEAGARASDLLASASGLSRGAVKDAMAKGAVWLSRPRGKRRRLRRASFQVAAGDLLALYYDAELLARTPPQAVCLRDLIHYSVWEKPPGLLSQGSDYGDHCSLARQAELAFTPRRPVFVVHRLDREARGLMLLAHSRQAAAALSALFRDNGVEKRYQVEVLGHLDQYAARQIDLPLDGKNACTLFTPLSYDPQTNTSRADVRITTGRLHQIRRHFAMIGYPVMGDPRYGSGNKNSRGLCLVASALGFDCPFTRQRMDFSLR